MVPHISIHYRTHHPKCMMMGCLRGHKHQTAQGKKVLIKTATGDDG